MQKIKKAVIPVAGFGTRFLPASKAIPKELLPILDKPVLQYLVEEAIDGGIEEIIFIVSEEKDAIRNHFSPFEALEENLASKGEVKAHLLEIVKAIPKLAKFHYVNQPEALGDGNAILYAKDLVGEEAFLILFGDELIFHSTSPAKQLIEAYEKTQSPIVGLQEVEKNLVEKYGIISPKSSLEDGVVEVASFVEKPKVEEAPSNLAIVGKYVATYEIFSILENNPNESGEIRLIDALSEFLKQGKVFGKVLEGKRFDCGSKLGWMKANIDLALEDGEISEEIRKHLESK